DVPAIIRMGGKAYAELGTEQSKGTRVYSLSGHVERPGNYELPLTLTYRDLIEGYGGGIKGGHKLKAFVPGGASMPIKTADQSDVGLAFEAVQAAGSSSGSGGVIVLDERTCMVQFALRTAQFYRHESCGKCTPCREGTRWMVEVLTRIETGEAALSDI